jgi:FMN phosphatase YigB (HAD superfamily)
VSIKAVCFDLGGVLVRICATWPEAMASAAVHARSIAGSELQDCRAFDLYQAGSLDELTYLESLGDYLNGLTIEEARAVHNGILVEAYPDTMRLVTDLESRGIVTGCLSNTNAIHWAEMTATDRFPAIARLKAKTASHLARASKPDPAIYRAFEKEAGVGPGEILNFDDVPDYVAAAQKAGWNAHLVDPDGDPAAQMRKAMETFGLL